jgi:Lon protease-like protein
MFELPLFPLNTVLFPGMPIHLRIFEPRYLAMVQRCRENDRPFGVVLIRSGQEALVPAAQQTQPHMVGCTARIIHVESAENGNLNLVALGDERFRIVKLQRSLPYLIGDVEIMQMDNLCGLDVQRGIKSFRERVMEYLRLFSSQAPHQVDLGQIQLPDDPTLMIYLSASLLQVPLGEKQELLTLDSSMQLMERVAWLFKRETAILKEMISGKEHARQVARLN